MVLWYLFPGRRYEVASAHDSDGTILGYYTNFVRPPELREDSWHLTDLYLDVWQAPGDEARLLDKDDLDRAVEAGVLGRDEAREVEAEAAAVIQAARAGRWPPKIVREYPIEDVPALRLRRDEPGTYFANLIVGRLIAFGIYALGAISLTSLAFAAMTDVFQVDGPGLVVWMTVIGVELAILFVLSLAGRLPATRRPRPEEVLTEKILFTGALISGLALFLYPDSELWRNGLLGIYSALGVFLAVFAWARLRYEQRFPGLAATGVVVCLVALLILF